MKKSLSASSLRLVLAATSMPFVLALAGCSGQSQVSHEDEVKAFRGDPQKIAEAQRKSMADRDRAAAQAQPATH